MSYRTSIRRVADVTLPLGRRYVALRSAVGYYCPLGFEATWAYVTTEARPWGGRRWDGAALGRAAEILNDSRAVWLAEIAAFAALRRTEKAAGRRSPRASDVEDRPRWPSTQPPSQLGLVAAVAAQPLYRLPKELADLQASLNACASAYINRLGYVDDAWQDLLRATAADVRRRTGAECTHLVDARRLVELLEYAVTADRARGGG